MSYTRRNTSSDATWARAWTADTLADLVTISALTGYERPHHGDIAFVTATGFYYLWMDDGSWTQITGLASGSSQISPVIIRQNNEPEPSILYPPGVANLVNLPGYSQGTFTPVDASGAGLVFTSTSGNYIQIGRLIFVSIVLIYPATANGATATVGGLPFTVNASIGNQLFQTYSGGGPIVYGNPIQNTTHFVFSQANGAGGTTNAQMSGVVIVAAGNYISV